MHDFKLQNYAIILIGLLHGLLIPSSAMAVRPFVTDDANVVGKIAVGQVPTTISEPSRLWSNGKTGIDLGLH